MKRGNTCPSSRYRETYKFSLSHNKAKQTSCSVKKKQQASAKSIKMSPLLFFTFFIIAASTFPQTAEKAEAGRVRNLWE